MKTPHWCPNTHSHSHNINNVHKCSLRTLIPTTETIKKKAIRWSHGRLFGFVGYFRHVFPMFCCIYPAVLFLCVSVVREISSNYKHESLSLLQHTPPFENALISSHQQSSHRFVSLFVPFFSRLSFNQQCNSSKTTTTMPMMMITCL